MICKRKISRDENSKLKENRVAKIKTNLAKVINLSKIPFGGCFSGNSSLAETSVDGEKTQSARCIKDKVPVIKTVRRKQMEFRKSTPKFHLGSLSGKFSLGEIGADGGRT